MKKYISTNLIRVIKNLYVKATSAVLFNSSTGDSFQTIINLRFADDIDGLAGVEELANLVERLGKASTAYSMEISAKKNKLMTKNTSVIKQHQWHQHRD